MSDLNIDFSKPQTIKQIRTAMHALYPVNSVQTGYAYWYDALVERSLRMFKYSGLPDSLPADQLEIRLIESGVCPIIKSEKYGLTAVWGSVYDFDQYYRPTRMTFAQPRLTMDSRSYNIYPAKQIPGLPDCAVIYNDTTDMYQARGLREMIQRYARQLADLDSSISILTVNSRMTRQLVAPSQAVAQSAQAQHRLIEAGEMQVLDQMGYTNNLKSVDFSQGTLSEGQMILQLQEAKEQILRDFYGSIGIRSLTEKRERMVTDEVTADTQQLLVNIQDMLKMRRAGLKHVNELFNTDITVEIAEEHDPRVYDLLKEVTDNADQ